MTLSQWADKYFRIVSGTGGDTGKWETLPYQRGIMDLVSNPEIKHVIVQKSSRIGYTKMVTAWVAYCMHYEPRSVLVTQPTDEDAEGYSKDEIAPMLAEIPALRGLVVEAKKSNSNNTIKEKRYPGGKLKIVGATSPKNFRRVYADTVIIDEWDGNPLGAGKEGDQAKLAEKRAQSSPFKKIIKGSTPTVKSESRVVPAYRATDQRKYYVPCPHCDHPQTLEFKNMVWDKKLDDAGNVIEHLPNTAAFVCVSCAAVIEEDSKQWMVAEADRRNLAGDARYGWVAESTCDPDTAGVFIWTAYGSHPEGRWRDIVKEFLEAKHDPDPLRNKMRVFVNTVLGEPFDDSDIVDGEALDADPLRARAKASTYKMGEVPDGAAVLLATIDTQNEYLVLKVNGWGIDESWRIDRQIITGDVNTGPYDGVWKELDERLGAEYSHPSGIKLRIRAAMIDTGGGRTQAVYDYCARRDLPIKVAAIKGAKDREAPIIPVDKRNAVKWTPYRSKKGKRGRLVMLGVHKCKDLVYAEMLVDAEGTQGYMHFPSDWPDDAFDEITAELLKPVYHAGREIFVWVCPKGRRNEEFDLEGYQRALLVFLKLDLEKEVEMLQKLIVAKDESPEAPAQTAPTPQKPRPRVKWWEKR